MRRAFSVLLLSMLPVCLYGQTEDKPPRISLRDARISPATRREIVAVIVKTLHEDAGTNALDFFVEFPKLAEDGRRTISVQGSNGYSGMQSSPFWLFQIIGGHVSLMLFSDAKGYGPTSQAFHNGMRDYQLSEGCCGQSATTIYRFDSRRYRAAICEAMTSNQDGSDTKTRVKCSSRY